MQFYPWALEMIKEILNPWNKDKTKERYLKYFETFFFSQVISSKRELTVLSSTRYLYPPYMYVALYSENPLGVNSDQIEAYESPIWHMKYWWVSPTLSLYSIIYKEETCLNKAVLLSVILSDLAIMLGGFDSFPIKVSN